MVYLETGTMGVVGAGELRMREVDQRGAEQRPDHMQCRVHSEGLRLCSIRNAKPFNGVSREMTR